MVDSSGVSGIPETRMSDRRPYCSSSSNCRRRFSFSWRKRLTSARIGSTICWIKSWTSSLIEGLTDALTTSAIFCRSSLDSVRGWGNQRVEVDDAASSGGGGCLECLEWNCILAPRVVVIPPPLRSC